MSTSDPFLKPIQPIGSEEAEKIPAALADELLIREQEARGEIKVFSPEESLAIAGSIAFLIMMKESLELTPIRETPGQLKDSPQSNPLILPLRHLYKHLKQLTDIDQSKNSAYSATLASLWNEILIISAKNNLTEATPLIQDIQTYTNGTKYSLGYYLSLYAGKSWFPFPYIELIEKLHQDYIAHPKESLLQKWLNLLETLV